MEDNDLLKALNQTIREVAREAILDILKEELPSMIQELSKPGNPLSDYLTYTQVTEMLGVTKATIHNYIVSGKLTKYSLTEGGTPFLKASDIAKAMKGQRRISQSLN
jgi:hypothetical protein